MISNHGGSGDVLNLTNKKPMAVAIVDGAGNQVTSFGGSGGTSSSDDAPGTAGSTSGTPMMGFATSDAVDSGDIGIVKMLVNRQLAVTIFDSAGVEAAIGAQYAEDTVSSAGDSITMAGVVRKDTAASLVNTDGDRTQMQVGALGHLWTEEKSGSAIAGSVDGVEGLLTTINGNISVLAGVIPTAATQVHTCKNYTTQQTGTDVWSPASGKKIAVTSVIISSYGTTGGRVILWFGDNADTTYSAGTDQVLAIFNGVPSTTVKPGMVYTPRVPTFCNTADRELHITTDAAMSLDIVIEGYEF